MGSSKSKTAPEPTPQPVVAPAPATVQPNQNPAPVPEPAPTEPPAPVYGTYTPSTEFPSAALLTGAQRDYLAANVEHPLDGDRVPFPFPPPTTKNEVFRLEDYAAVDSHALQTPLSVATTTYEDLASHLTSPATNDIGKVRAFFVWISGQGLQKIDAYYKPSDIPRESPLFLLYSIILYRKGGSYVDLLAGLCRAANIPVRVVKNGMVRAMNYTVGDETINGYNRHCLVYVDSAWRIIDQHWGSEGVIVQANRDWDLIAGQGNTTKQQPDELQYVYERDEDYFLTDPERHVFCHWCPDKAEQLLARPVSESEFIKLAYLKTGFFQLGFTSMSHPTCKVSTDSGQVVLKLGLPEGKKVNVIYSLFKWKYVKESNVIEGASLERYVFVANTNEGLEVTINFRLYGKHRLELYGLTDGKFSYSPILEYLIFVNKPDHLAKPFPQTNNNTFGMSQGSEEIGIKPADSKIGGSILARDGIAVIRYLRTTKATTEFIHELVSEDGSTELRNYIRQYITETEVVFLVYIPKNGQYVFKLRGRQSNQWKETHVCQYLITSDRGCVEQAPFPKSNSGRDQIGNVAKDERTYVVPASHPDPYVEWQEKGEMIITMNIVEEANFSAQLWWCSDDQNESNFSEFLLFERTTSQITVDVKYQRVGTYKVNVMANSNLVYQYIVKVRAICEDLAPFPQQLNKWNSQYKLIAPRGKNLLTNQTVHFKMEVQSVKSVRISVGSVSTLLVKGEQDSWEGDADTGSVPGNVTVYCEPLQTPGAQDQLLLLTVQNQESMSKVNAARARAEDEAVQENNRRISAEKREAEEADKQRKEADDLARKKDEEFRKNIETYKRLEREMDEEDKKAQGKEEVNEFSSEPVDENLTNEDLIERRVTEKKEAEKRLPLWQPHYEKMKPDLARIRLREAAVARDQVLLRQAIEDCRSYPMGSHEEEIQEAEALLIRLEHRQELAEAILSRDCEAIRAAIDHICDAGLEKQFEPEINQAEHRIEIIKKMNNIKHTVLGMDRNTMMELRSYKVPPKAVHSLMQAFFLLLGEDESLTAEWRHCQKLCRSQGHGNLLNRVANFNASSVHPEIAARSTQILDTVDLIAVQDLSVGVATFYIWSKGILEESNLVRVHNDDDSDSTSTMKPAGIHRQREIFNTSLSSDETPRQRRGNGLLLA